ncbi:unnamed protein product [Parnassius apollo]|uniref:(apollo) hypothetical protein n=1 Tax=Parnassius apollo TaxID=110799 RepID=A0A8S3Y0Y4_PARAO|nr:unnamed protein product [Parnassius apollo]
MSIFHVQQLDIVKCVSTVDVQYCVPGLIYCILALNEKEGFIQSFVNGFCLVLCWVRACRNADHFVSAPSGSSTSVYETSEQEELTFQSTSQATLQSTSQDTLQSTSQDTLQSTSQATLQSTSQATLQSTSQNTLQSTSQDTLQSTSQATSEATPRLSETIVLPDYSAVNSENKVDKLLDSKVVSSEGEGSEGVGSVGVDSGVGVGVVIGTGAYTDLELVDDADVVPLIGDV